MPSGSSVRTSTVLTVAGATLVGGFLAYAVYFDYKRRNDVDFRRKLRKEKKRVQKSAASTVETSSISADELRAAIAKIREEEVPESSSGREQYFMTQVGIGEQLCTQGPSFALTAALAFYRALRVYPSPVELIMIYQRTVPEEVFKIVVEMTNLDAQSVVEGYYESFPPKSMNVSIKDNDAKKKIMVAEKDFEAGDVIYTEEPVVAALDADLQAQGVYCTHCLRLIHKASAIEPEGDRLGAVYCSEDCRQKSKAQSHGFLFTSDPVLPTEVLETDPAARAKAQAAFVELLKSSNKVWPLLIARFAARQISFEIKKLLPESNIDLKLLELPKYYDGPTTSFALADHFERLRYVDVKAPEEESNITREVFIASFPGMEQFLTDERYAVMLGKMAYNAFGVCYSGGRDDRPVPEARPEEQERTRTPHGTSRQVGSGVYMVSAYINHSCDPSAKPTFKNGNYELHLVATRPIKKGEEITVSYVDTTLREGETAAETRRRRRYELARGWRFKCECSLCKLEEGAGSGELEEGALGVQKDESKLEPAIERLTAGAKTSPDVFRDTD